MNMFEQAKDVALTGTSDLVNNNYLGVTARFTDRKQNLQWFEPTVSKTGENLCSNLTNMLLNNSI